MKRATAAVVVLILLLAGCASSNAVNDSKKAVKAADSAWTVAREAVAGAYLDGKVTDAQLERFRALDRKVLASGRLLRSAVRAWETGQAHDNSQVNLLTSQLFGLLVEGAKLAAELGVDISDLNRALQVRNGGVR